MSALYMIVFGPRASGTPGHSICLLLALGCISPPRLLLPRACPRQRRKSSGYTASSKLISHGSVMPPCKRRQSARRCATPKKSTGFDGIPPNLVKISAEIITDPCTTLINRAISADCFPDELKYASVAPVYKKEHILKHNFRPVSILPCLSNNFKN